MAPPSKVQRKTLSVEDKIRLLDLATDNSNKISDLLSQFTIGLCTFYKSKAQETALSIKEFTEWVSSDNDVACYGDLTDAEIIAQVRHTDMPAEEDDDEEEQEAPRKPTRQDALIALETTQLLQRRNQ
uniref:Uncharacterized protein n=1 Tax=Plectus sambesii TaxID=2011161 RepID=A0A914WQJ0_9BILA